MTATIMIDAWYSGSVWSQVAEDEEARDLFLERFAGLSILIQERQTAAEWVRDTAKRWTYRPPISGHLINNHETGPADVWWGPGPGGCAARKLASLVTFAYGGVL